MKQLVILFILLVSFSYTSCKKKENAPPLVTPTNDSTKVDSISPNNAIIYPYTDTFSGSLHVSCTWRMISIYDTTESGYLFFVTHINIDSIVFISSDSIYQGTHLFPDKFFCSGYKTTPSNSYVFNNYYSGDIASPLPTRNTDSFYLSGPVLQVGWEDRYGDEVRLSNPTGGIQITMSNCSYTGALIKH
jgi:hypothetical protein